MNRSVTGVCVLVLAGSVTAQAGEKEKPAPAVRPVKPEAKPGAKPEAKVEAKQEPKPDAKPDATQKGLTQAELSAQARLEEAFERYDRNKDGVLARDEFPGSPEQFGNIDRNKNSKLTKEEFKGSPLARSFLERNEADDKPARERFVPPAEREPLRLVAWTRLDRDKDGKVARDEWTGTVKAFEVLDRNGDGGLDRRDVAASAEPVRAGPKLDGPPFAGGVRELLARHDRNKDERISREEAGQVRLGRMFDAIDTNKNGELSEAELQVAVYALDRMTGERDRGSSEQKSQRYELTFDAWDKDKNEKLSTDEFMGPRELFPMIDRNRDAVLSRVEVETFMREMNEVEFLKKYDGNGDGRVTRDEFPGTDEVFRRADKSGDGAVTTSDR